MERSERAADEAYGIYRDAIELAVDAMIVYRASLKLREIRRRVGKEGGIVAAEPGTPAIGGSK
jgi:hypothetical protein